MKKVFKTLLVALIMVTTISINTYIEVKAISNGYYDFGCEVGQYELSYITDSGNFQKVECYSSFSSAKEAMLEKGSDYVVRNYNSLSPSMIVAMVSGKAYSYPARANSSTMTIYQDANQETYHNKTTYVANHYEMDYHYTERCFSSGVGIIAVTLNGFEGYTDLEYTDLVPDKFIDNGLAIYLGGNDRTSQNEQPFRVIVRRNYYTVSNDELIFVYHRSYSSASNYMDEEYRLVIGPAPDGFENGRRYYSSNGYDFYTDAAKTNYFATYYPYYQYLPLRSKTNLSASELDAAFAAISGASNSALRGNGQYFINAQEEYGINALLLYALAAHESAWGTSSYALNRNNLFGWNAIDSDPNQASYFSSVEDAVNEMAGYNLRKYSDIYNPLFFGTHVGNKGSGFNVKYASDPYWGLKISAIAYQIDKNSGLKDYETYDLAVVDEFDVSFVSASGKELFTSQYGTYYQEAFTVIVLKEEGNMALVQSPNPLSGNTVYTTYNSSASVTYRVDNVMSYDYDESVVYINTSDLEFINGYSSNNTSEEYSVGFSDFTWPSGYESGLSITGYAYLLGKDKTGASVYMNLESSGYNLRENLDLISSSESDVINFDHWLKVSELPVGTYTFMVETVYPDGTTVKENINPEIIPTNSVLNGKNYTFDVSRGYLRLTVSNQNTSLNGTKISYINEIKLDDGILYLDGTAFAIGNNYYEGTTHDVYLLDQSNNRVYLKTRANTYSNFTSLNDGYRYEYVGFRTELDLSELSDGKYQLMVSLDGYDGFEIKDTSMGVIAEGAYIVSVDSNYNSRIEIEVSKGLAQVVDVEDIKKPSQRASFTSNNVSIDGNSLVVDGYGWIFYTNFNTSTQTDYDIYLVSNTGAYYSLNTNKVEGDSRITAIYSYDYSDVFYRGNIDLSNVQKGTYTIYLAMGNNRYYDVIALYDQQGLTSDSTTINGKSYRLYTSSLNDRLVLEVS